MSRSEKRTETKIELYVDDNLAKFIPDDKVKYRRQWNTKIRSPKLNVNLNHSFWKGLIETQIYGKHNLADTEIHVVWVPHVPLDSTRDTTMSIHCNFTPSIDSEKRTLSSTVFPVGMASHSIFRPGHSIMIGPFEKIPWEIEVEISENIFSCDYTYAEIYFCVMGYKTGLGYIDVNRGSTLISLMPTEEAFQGFSIERPRTIGSNWKIKNYKLGIRTNTELKKVLKLQELKIDVEALMASGCLKKVLKSLSTTDLDATETYQKLEVMKKIKSVLKM